MEVDDNQKDQHGREEIGQVRQVAAVECLLNRADLVVAGDQQVDQSNESAFKLGSTASVDGGGGEGLPDDALADVGRDEEGNTRTKTITCGKKKKHVKMRKTILPLKNPMTSIEENINTDVCDYFILTLHESHLSAGVHPG